MRIGPIGPDLPPVAETTSSPSVRDELFLAVSNSLGKALIAEEQSSGLVIISTYDYPEGMKAAAADPDEENGPIPKALAEWSLIDYNSHHDNRGVLLTLRAPILDSAAIGSGVLFLDKNVYPERFFVAKHTIAGGKQSRAYKFTDLTAEPDRTLTGHHMLPFQRRSMLPKGYEAKLLREIGTLGLFPTYFNHDGRFNLEDETYPDGEDGEQTDDPSES